MNIINAKLSSCCSSSVSPHYGKDKSSVGVNYKGNLNFHYTCNKCGKECEMNKVPYWELILVKTKLGFTHKYKKLQLQKQY